MTKEKSIQLAATAWCDPTTEKIEMDTRLALVFAQMLRQAYIDGLKEATDKLTHD